MPLLVRIIWFLLFGWWLGYIAIWLAWIGLFILNRLPQIITLRPESDSFVHVDTTRCQNPTAQENLTCTR